MPAATYVAFATTMRQVAAVSTMRAGMTDPLLIQLQQMVAGATAITNFDLTGATVVEVHLLPTTIGASPTVISIGSKLSITDAVNGKLALIADALTTQLYTGWIKVVTAANVMVSFPNDGEFKLNVLPAF